MSKTNSHHFFGTSGVHLQNTSKVWEHIKATQECHDGTILPKSFKIDTPRGVMWTHGNATEHIYEAIISLKDSPKLKNSDPNLYTQFILYDYWKTLGSTTRNGITYERKLYCGNWEFIFSKASEADKNPVVKHAKFTGFK